jgi:uncharacterized RDD family membrane protein YckC
MKRVWPVSQESRFCSKCGASVPAGSAFCPSCGAPVALSSGVPVQAPLSGFDALTKESNVQLYWFKRLMAFVIDAIIVVIVLVIAAVVLVVPVLLLSGVGALAAIFAGVFSVLAGLFLLLYFTVAEASMGATIGKRVMGLKVVARNGGRPNIAEAFVRNISKIYWVLLLLDVVVGLATSKQYTQKFSDRFIGTSVVAQ